MADEIAPLEGVTGHFSGVTDVNAAGLDETGSTRLGDLMSERAPPPFDEADLAEDWSGREAEKRRRSKSCDEV